MKLDELAQVTRWWQLQASIPIGMQIATLVTEFLTVNYITAAVMCR